MVPGAEKRVSSEVYRGVPPGVIRRLGVGLGLLLAVVCSPAGLVWGEPTELPRIDPAAAGLAAEGYGQRFDAALALVTAQRPDLEEIVADAVRVWRATDAVEAAAAGDFVLRKMRGQPIPKANAAPGSLPDVVLVSIDTLRADHLHCYGYERPTSPTLDSLAAGGVLFETTISPSSWTLPVHMSLFTSLYPSFHKIDLAGRVGSIKLDAAVPTLPELLKKQGYVGAGFAANGYLNPVWGFGRGFDFYREYVTDAQAQLARAALWVEWHAFHRSLGLSNAPLLVFVHLLDPHGTGSNLIFLEDGVEKTDPRYRIAVYDGQINFVDAQLKAFVETLGSLGTLRSTLVVITADHGEALGDHGGWGHKSTLYEDQLKVPLIMSYPGKIGEGRRVPEQVSLLDVAPTVLDLIGVNAPDSFQGISLAANVRNDRSPSGAPIPTRVLFAELHPASFGPGRDFYRRAARGERYKLIRTRFADGHATNELYDLREDPAESENVYESAALSSARNGLEKQLDDFMQRAAAYRPGAGEGNRIELDPEIRERLRALGYED